MIDIKHILISQNTSIKDSITVIDNGGVRIVLIVDEEGRLVGTLTDGDIRRAILRNVSFNDPVEKIMHKTPVTANSTDSDEKILNLMKLRVVSQIPILDESLRVIGIKLWDELTAKGCEKDNPVIILAGGLGKRLKPLTDNIPKPLVKIGDKPILEIIIEKLKSYGFTNIFISVNYKSSMIEDYFQDGRTFGVKISYLKEKYPLGTASSIRLAKKYISLPFLSINGDILTNVNFDYFLHYHLQYKYDLTIAVSKYQIQVPYGIIKFEEDRVTKIEEKPEVKFYINAGLYILTPEIIDLIPEDRYFDMTELINIAIREKISIGCFPIREYWLDVGGLSDFEKAQKEYKRYFE